MNELHINDIFWTWQGEGKHSGRRALFIRMPYCNLACSWCDTKFDTFKKYSEDEFLKYIRQAPEADRFAVITGGEPTLHKHTQKIVTLLKKEFYEIAVESNGTTKSEIYSLFDWVTISPKRQSEDKGLVPYFISKQAMKFADEFKYVVDDQFDFNILKRHSSLSTQRLSLSPEYTNMRANVEKIKDFTEKHPEWLISLQTHKFIGVP